MYYLIDATTTMYEHEISETEYKDLYANSETEQDGNAVDAEAILVEDGTLMMYKKDGTWYSVPKAYASMTIRLM